MEKIYYKRMWLLLEGEIKGGWMLGKNILLSFIQSLGVFIDDVEEH